MSTRAVHFPPAKTLPPPPEDESPEANKPSHPINLFGTLVAEAARIRKHTAALPDSGHRLKGELHILRGSLKRAIEACDHLIDGMEGESK